MGKEGTDRASAALVILVTTLRFWQKHMIRMRCTSDVKVTLQSLFVFHIGALPQCYQFFRLHAEQTILYNDSKNTKSDNIGTFAVV